MTFTKKQNDDLCVAAGIAPVGACLIFGTLPVLDAAPVYPDLLTAEGFLILWRALMSKGCLVKITTDRAGEISAYVDNFRLGHETKGLFKSVEEALFFSAAIVLEVIHA
jgi:hypothetical protein